ncbi:MAG: hypothetical protein F7B06_02145 [Opitutae bacterium]|nr:hypothetical protein [Opitutae bacterium]
MAVEKPLNNPGRSTLLKNTLAVVACLAVFALILPLALRTGNPASPAADGAEALPTAAELQARDWEILHSYGWVDQEKGVVRLPIRRARQLFADETNPK